MGKKNSTKQEISRDDSRFKDIATNPLFKEIPRKDRKVLVDERFQSMFKDSRFKVGAFKVDKRGRKLDLSSNQHLANLYDIEQSDGKSSSSEKDAEEEDDQESSDHELEAKIEIKLDLARGEGNVSSSSEESDGDQEDDDEIVKQLAEDVGINSWGEMDRSVDRVEWASRRMAICNLDWDRLRADDLLIVLNSFKPESGEILSVSVYLSDFGAERLKDEEEKGPVLPAADTNDLAASEKDSKKSKEMIRAYQLERLRYYYAVCECDSEETAIAIYEGCDGVEYETSGVRFDLRFIPNEMPFDDDRLREKVCSGDVNVENYKPKHFESLALSNCNTKLTWDENDPERSIAIAEAFKEDADINSFGNLIAPPSDSEENEEEDKTKLHVLLHGGFNKSIQDAGNLRVKREKRLDAQEDVDANRRGKKRRKVGNTKSTGSLDLICDGRFSALFTDSAFAIDTTSSHYKGGTLAIQQVNEKRKRRKY